MAAFWKVRNLAPSRADTAPAPRLVPPTPDAYQREVIAHARYFTAVLNLGPHVRQRFEFDVQNGNRAAALDEARRKAKELGERSLVYAVDAFGRSIDVPETWTFEHAGAIK